MLSYKPLWGGGKSPHPEFRVGSPVVDGQEGRQFILWEIWLLPQNTRSQTTVILIPVIRIKFKLLDKMEKCFGGEVF